MRTRGIGCTVGTESADGTKGSLARRQKSERNGSVQFKNPFLAQHFDDFVLIVAEEIFAQALGRSVADVLVHNFRIREPSLAHGGSRSGLQSKIEVFQKLLAESFGEFHSSIMQVIVEEVYALTGFEAKIDSANVFEALEKVRSIYPDRREAGAAIS